MARVHYPEDAAPTGGESHGARDVQATQVAQDTQAAQIARVGTWLRSADGVLVVASNGFDIADGYQQFACDEAFRDVFGAFRRAYGLTSIIQGLAARWPSWEARWAFLARLISYGCLDYRPSPVMQSILRIMQDTEHFVVTCNCNGRFERAGVPHDALFETEGSYARLRCSVGCSDVLYDAAPVVERLKEGEGGALASDPGDAPAIPAELVPRCPRCDAPLDVAVDDRGGLAGAERFQEQQRRLRAFLDRMHGKNVVVLELGMGQRNQAIKAPLMRWAAGEPHARYVVINREPALLPQGMGERAQGIVDDLGPVLTALADAVEREA